MSAGLNFQRKARQKPGKMKAQKGRLGVMRPGCPVSAALFFGSLIPLTVQNNSPTILPSLYGIGTGLPVLVFAIIITSGTRNISRVFNAVTRTEYWARKITAWIVIAVGIYYILTKIFYLNLF